MKQIFLSGCVLGLTLSLSACGGGGGGGGSSSGGGGTVSIPPDRGAMQAGTAFTHKQLAGDATAQSDPYPWPQTNYLPNKMPGQDSIAQALGSINGGYASYALRSSGLPMERTGYVLRVESDGSVTLKNGGSSIATFNANKINFYTKNGMNFSVMSDTKSKGANATQTDFIWVGKLNITIFGYWAQVSNTQGQKAYLNGDTFLFNYGATKAYYNGINLGTFTGIAAGMVAYNNKTSGNASTTMPLMGTASLNIASASSGTLLLNFPGFYKLTGNVNTFRGGVTATAGGFTGSFTALEKNSGYTFPVDLPAISGFSGAGNINSIQGQLFGASNYPGAVDPTIPAEAAGTWRLKSSTAARDIEIIGAFGVKK